MSQDFGPIEGTWEGSLSYLKGEGLRNPEWPPDFWRLMIQANSVRVFFKRGGNTEEVKEVKPGKYKIERYMTNVIIFSIDSGRDDDSVWVETEAFLLTQKAPNVMVGALTGAVNNVDLPIDQDISKFVYAATGEFHRL